MSYFSRLLWIKYISRRRLPFQLFGYRILLVGSLSFAVLTTALLMLQALGIFPFASPASWSPNRPPVLTAYFVLGALQSRSLLLAPLGWGAVLGVWIWRGRTKTQWMKRGLDRSSFRLLLQMRGSATRITILNSLSTPRDRFQLSEELGLDWTTVDYHIKVLLKHGLISEKTAYGSVKFYQLTPTGSVLLRALGDMNKEENAKSLRES
jgi:DNA-binding MarR family transcriptional regulator